MTSSFEEKKKNLPISPSLSMILTLAEQRPPDEQFTKSLMDIFNSSFTFNLFKFSFLSQFLNHSSCFFLKY